MAKPNFPIYPEILKQETSTTIKLCSTLRKQHINGRWHLIDFIRSGYYINKIQLNAIIDLFYKDIYIGMNLMIIDEKIVDPSEYPQRILMPEDNNQESEVDRLKKILML